MPSLWRTRSAELPDVVMACELSAGKDGLAQDGDRFDLRVALDRVAQDPAGASAVHNRGHIGGVVVGEPEATGAVADRAGEVPPTVAGHQPPGAAVPSGEPGQVDGALVTVL